MDGRTTFTPITVDDEEPATTEACNEPKWDCISVDGSNSTNCPVPDCPYHTSKPISMRNHA
jgi:hypothetical protein